MVKQYIQVALCKHFTKHIKNKKRLLDFKQAEIYSRQEKNRNSTLSNHRPAVETISRNLAIQIEIKKGWCTANTDSKI